MIVRYWMTRCPLLVAEEKMSLRDAFQLMSHNRVRRLPVVNGSKLKGIITLSDLYSFIYPAGLHTGNGAPSIAAVEALGRHIVRDVMATKVLTCEMNEPLEDAGALMRGSKVGALPVMNGQDLVGIITESDVLDALMSIARVGDDTRRLYLRVPVAERHNVFQDILDICRGYGVELYTLLTHPLKEDASHLIMLKFRGDKTEKFMQALWASHCQVLMSRGKETVSSGR
jgi:acetoin utilization protein AcuB